MSLTDIFLIVPSPAVSGVIWLIALTLLLYFARQPSHQAILSISRILHHAFRMGASSMMRAERLLVERNREVLLAAGREAAERVIEREFERVENALQKDLAEYPALQRRLNEQISRLDGDYQESAEVPPEPPGWSRAVEAVANIPSKGDPMVAQVLEDIHSSLVKAQGKAVQEYRGASLRRHRVLQSMMPRWRRVRLLLSAVDRNVTDLIERSKIIGRYMDEYQEILKKSDRAVRLLSASAFSQFFVSAFVLIVAIGGAMINFTLIARPMAEMVGGQSFIMGFKTSEIAALVIILVEVSMGLFLMESLRITRLFPVIGALNDKLRVRMIWVTFSILFILASVEAGLAFMREILLQDELATSALLRGEESGAYQAADFVWITTAAQMGMGFILPFALVFVAIPLETFVHSLRVVLGMAGAMVLRAVAAMLRTIGGVLRYAGGLMVSLYDVLIFGPLWIETRLKTAAQDRREREPSQPAPGESITIREASL